jgi:transcriptional regulator
MLVLDIRLFAVSHGAVVNPTDHLDPLTFYRSGDIVPVEAQREHMPEQSLDLPQGTLDLLILRTLVPGPNHGWAISERIHQVSNKVLQIQQGSLYPALHRLERRGWIKASWGVSENNRRAKYYELSKSGRKQLEAEQGEWKKLVAAVAQILETA